MTTASTTPVIDLMQRLAANQRSLHRANELTRELRGMNIIVQRIDIGITRPRLYLKSAPPAALDMRGITRRPLPDGEVVECAGLLRDCEVMWTEWFEEMAA